MARTEKDANEGDPSSTEAPGTDADVDAEGIAPSSQPKHPDDRDSTNHTGLTPDSIPVD